MATSAIPETVEQIIPEVSPNAEPREKASVEEVTVEVHDGPFRPSPRDYVRWLRDLFTRQRLLESAAVVVKLGKFMGPGAIISVAYIDPDNYQTAVSSGTQFQYKLLFMILVSNLIAIYLQVSSGDFVEVQLANLGFKALSVKLGSVTGMDLAQCNRAYLPRWLNIGLWLMAEAAIVCTDIGQVSFRPQPRTNPLDASQGDRDSHCNQYPHSQDPPGRGLRLGHSGYAGHTDILPPRRIAQRSSSIRALRHRLRAKCLYLLLHRTLPDQRHNRQACLRRLPALTGDLRL